MSCPTQLPAWRQLEALASQAQSWSVAELFDRDSKRFERFSRQWSGHVFDFSKQRMTQEVLDTLLALAAQSGLHAQRAALWAGSPLNLTENRAVLHVALRDRAGRRYALAGDAEGSINRQVDDELARMQAFVTAVRDGQWLGYTGQPITDVVSIGIGGSNLGPQTVCQALAEYADERLQVHFVSNVDGISIHRTLAKLNPATTLFVVASKTFTTRETMINAQTARQWLLADGTDANAVAQHFAAVTAATDKAQAMGISADNIFAMWDWVGGRFSLWSAIGLPIALYLGFEHFDALLAGAQAMDEHFLTAPDSDNLPLLMALVGIWNSTFLQVPTLAILPYDQGLSFLPAYLQQAEMESNGKSVQRDGRPVSYNTCPIVWGQLGIDGQHAFYQLLHQGTHAVAADFIGSKTALHALPDHHENLLANLIAQTQALMAGVGAEQVSQSLRTQGLDDRAIGALVPHKVHAGNRSSSTLLLERLSPHSLGALIALYEHKIFAQGVIWNICSYDQWGVELGKQLAGKVERQLKGEPTPADQDGSTSGLVQHCRAARG